MKIKTPLQILGVCLGLAILLNPLARASGLKQNSASAGLGALHAHSVAIPSVPAGQARTSATATKWMQNPVVIKAGVSGTFFAGSNSPVALVISSPSGGSQTNIIYGLGETNQTNFVAIFVDVHPNETCRATISGGELLSWHLDFIKPDRHDLQAGKSKRHMRPRGYQLTVDNVDKSAVDDVNPNGTGYAAAGYSLVLRPEREAGVGGTTEEIAEDVAPGDAPWSQIGPSVKDNAALGQVKWDVALGRLLNGRSAGKMRISEEGLTTNLFTPGAIIYDPPVTNQELVATIYDENNFLSQLKAPQTFVNVVTNTNGYALQFYFPSAVLLTTNSLGTNDNGYYDLASNAAPFVVWRFTDVNGDQTELRLEELRDGITNVTRLGYTNSVRWLEYGTGAEKRIELRQVGTTGQDRFETNLVMTAGGTVASKTVEKYHHFSWGWELVSLVADPDGAALTTTQEYYTSGPELGKLKWIISPDGHWEKRIYSEGAHVATLTPWKDGPQSPADASPGNSDVTVFANYASFSGSPIQVVSKYIGPYLESKGKSTADLVNPTPDYETRLTMFQYSYNQKAWERKPICDGIVDFERSIEGLQDWMIQLCAGSGVYNRLSGDWMAGNKYLEYNARDIRTIYAYHRGVYAGGTFSAATDGNDWRVTQIRSYFTGGNVGFGVDVGPEYPISIEGQVTAGVWINPYQTTNTTTYYVNGLRVKEEVFV